MIDTTISHYRIVEKIMSAPVVAKVEPIQECARCA
jgi:hypothetical protein